MVVSTQRLKQNFSHAASEYDARAQFQHVQTRRVLDAALMLLPERARVLDVGCGTGYFAAAAQEKRPGWKILGLDIALGMCQIAATRTPVVAADAVRLPLADASLDAAVSSLCYQWIADSKRAFGELSRVLKPGATAMIATLGESTLNELRDCAARVGLPLSLLTMRTFTSMRENLEQAGFRITLADQQVETRFYPNVNELLNSMRAIGAGNNFVSGEARPLPPKRFAALVAEYEKLRNKQGIPASWDHHFFVLHKQ